MVKLRVIRDFFDIVLEKKVYKGFEMEVPPERANKLTSMGLAEILIIYKLSNKEYYEATGRKKGK